MKRHLKYLQYVLRHKYYVYKAGRELGLPVWHLLKHDLTKFLPSELRAYTDNFYPGDYTAAKEKKENRLAFNRSFRLHWARNPHHWEYWTDPRGIESTTLLDAKGNPNTVKAYEMPEFYVREMVADWRGASMAKGFGRDVRPWYERSRERMVLHSETRKLVEKLIGYKEDND